MVKMSSKARGVCAKLSASFLQTRLRLLVLERLFSAWLAAWCFNAAFQRYR
jgi:hypothetical protein